MLLSILNTSIAQTYYVAKNGRDSNPGNEDSPFLTIQKAANIVKAGDIVYVKAGTYNEQVNITRDGNSTHRITFTNYSGDTVNVTKLWNQTAEYTGIFYLNQAHYITIDGFNLIGGRAGIWTHRSNYSIIRNNYIKDPYKDGIRVSWYLGRGESTIVENNTLIKDLGNDITNPRNVTYGEMISIGEMNNVTVRYNQVIKNSHGEAITFKDNSTNGYYYNNIVEDSALGIYVGDSFGPIYIYNNIARNMSRTSCTTHENCASAGFAAASEYGWLTKDFYFYNNIAHDNSGPGFLLSATLSNATYCAGPQYENINFINNLAYHNSYWNHTVGNGWIGGITLDMTSTHAECKIRNITVANNIVIDNQYGQIMAKTGHPGLTYNISNNIVYGSGGTFPTSGCTMSYCNNNSYPDGNPFINAPPGLVLLSHTLSNFSSLNFHLNSTSVAIDKGISVNSPAFDFDGIARPSGSGYDIGAYEYRTSYPRYDVNEDGVVDINDLILVKQHFNEVVSIPYPKYDVKINGIVNIEDITIVAQHFGEITLVL